MNINVNKVKISVTTPLMNVEEIRKTVCEAGAGVMEIMIIARVL